MTISRSPIGSLVADSMLRTRITTSSPSITLMRSIPIRGLWKTPGSMWEINEANPYGYTIEMNKGDCGGEGAWRAGTTFVSKLSRAFLSKASLRFPKAFMPRVYRLSVATGVRSRSSCLSRKTKGVPIVHLLPGQTPDRMDHICSAFDQCIRVKNQRKSLKGL